MSSHNLKNELILQAGEMTRELRKLEDQLTILQATTDDEELARLMQIGVLPKHSAKYISERVLQGKINETRLNLNALMAAIDRLGAS